MQTRQAVAILSEVEAIGEHSDTWERGSKLRPPTEQGLHL